jgi:YVTN family beta-propeller protein
MLGTVLTVACERDNPEAGKDDGFLHGAYITNEGAFGNSNGSVSYFDTDSVKMINHIFESVNGRPLGDVVQSVGVAGEKGFIVVNNSQKVEIVNLRTFESIGTIDGLEYPRNFLAVNDRKGYMTDGNYNGRVYVIDLESLKITDTVPCGNGPEKLILHGSRVLVANSGGWGNDSTITVINTVNDQVAATWQVGMNPADLVLDHAGHLWALCKGKVVWNPDFSIGEETSSALVEVDPTSGEVLQTIGIGMTGDFYWPQRIGINKGKNRIYYLEAAGIYARNTDGTAITGQPLIAGNLYGFGIDPATDLIYALHSPSFTTSGWVFRYQPGGTKIDSLEVGIGPSQIIFN